ncbi:NAD(P)/FAD-dependent oxidoreductase [Sphingomonas sp. PAMC 26617]|uniref:NAD(P)/FAD-dependent oxidoreductase n=1 Tax=Sphingomonas sp. PAMC 26617 TaxID=1112216 RepID=UPI000287E411|nr:FAD/NAD(P)-binding oxidoreductase [Sphingomonas sp. PAMC 26617]
MSDVLVIGAGPAGMSAALELRSYDFSVTVIDDQPAPGGRIYAAIEQRDVHGAEDQAGADLVTRFRQAGIDYQPGAETWGIEASGRVFVTRNGQATLLEPKFIVLATGAQERPMAFPGWQLPGVMTVGAAQILLKTAKEIPDEPVWLAGSGPLLLLYVRQLIAAGGKVAGILDTTPPGRKIAAASLVPGALPYGWYDLLRGLGWLTKMRSIRIIRGVSSLAAEGGSALQVVRYGTRDGASGSIPTRLLLIHDGVVPSVHATMAAGCDHRWNPLQQSFEPVLDAYRRSSNPAIYIAGDAGSIVGARAAFLSGRLAAIGVALGSGRISPVRAKSAARPLQRALSSAAGFRQLVDTLYPPADLAIPDETMICRCEEVTAGRVRAVLRDRPKLGPDGVKIETRAGMGPCQGRQCGLTLSRLVREVHDIDPEAAGFLRIRSPLKPLTLGELATLETLS